MKIRILGAIAALAIAGSARAEPPPAALRPAAISGWGWNVMDLEAQRAWYVDKLGMKVLRTYERDGKTFEYILGYEGASAGSAILALLASPTRKPGPSTAGRIILRAPDAKALAEHLAKHGIQSRMVAPGAYFLNDPEGNPVELYTPPSP